MKDRKKMVPIVLGLLFYLALPVQLQAMDDHLPSWNDGHTPNRPLLRLLAQ